MYGVRQWMVIVVEICLTGDQEGSVVDRACIYNRGTYEGLARSRTWDQFDHIEERSQGHFSHYYSRYGSTCQNDASNHTMLIDKYCSSVRHCSQSHSFEDLLDSVPRFQSSTQVVGQT